MISGFISHSQKPRTLVTLSPIIQSSYSLTDVSSLIFHQSPNLSTDTQGKLPAKCSIASASSINIHFASLLFPSPVVADFTPTNSISLYLQVKQLTQLLELLKYFFWFSSWWLGDSTISRQSVTWTLSSFTSSPPGTWLSTPSPTAHSLGLFKIAKSCGTPLYNFTFRHPILKP